MDNVAFLGLGAMGYPMAANVRRTLHASATVHIYDVDAAVCSRFSDDFRHHGPVTIAKTPRDAASDATTVISMLPSADVVRLVYLDETDGIVAAPRNRDRLLLECSTIDSRSAKDVGSAMDRTATGTYVDTPVSGGVPAATDGSLSFLIGCSEDDRDLQSRITSVLTTMGSPDKFFWCGCLGAGLAAKISNNYLSCSILVGIAEAMAIGIRSGIEPGLLHRVIHHSSGQSWMLDNVQPVPGVLPHVPSSNNYKLGFKTQMMIKDVSLGVDAGEAVGIEPSIARAALEVYQQAAKNPKCIDRDGSSVYLHITGT